MSFPFPTDSVCLLETNFCFVFISLQFCMKHSGGPITYNFLMGDVVSATNEHEMRNNTLTPYIYKVENYNKVLLVFIKL